MAIKLKIILAGLVLLFSKVIVAQESKSAEELANYQTDLMMEELTLSEMQEKSISKINLEYTVQQKTLIDRDGSMFGKIGEMKKLKNGKKTELKQILSPEQYKKYEDEIEPKIKKYMRQHLKL